MNHGISACNPQNPPHGMEDKGASAKGKEKEKDSEKGVEEAIFCLDVWPPENPDLEARKMMENSDFKLSKGEQYPQG